MSKTVMDTKEIQFRRAKKAILDTESRKMELEIKVIELEQNVQQLKNEIQMLDNNLVEHRKALALIENRSE